MVNPVARLDAHRRPSERSRKTMPESNSGLVTLQRALPDRLYSHRVDVPTDEVRPVFDALTRPHVLGAHYDHLVAPSRSIWPPRASGQQIKVLNRARDG